MPMGVTVKVLQCPNCGAPVRVGMETCAYCQAGLSFEGGLPASQATVEAPYARQRKNRWRAARLERALSEGGGQGLWDAALKAWQAERTGSLDADQRQATVQALAALGLVYAAALEAADLPEVEYEARVGAIWALVDGAVPRATLNSALAGWDKRISEAGVEKLALELAQALQATHRSAVFELAAAAACPSGSFTDADYEVFEALAELLEVSEKDAEEVAERVARSV